MTIEQLKEAEKRVMDGVAACQPNGRLVCNVVPAGAVDDFMAAAMRFVTENAAALAAGAGAQALQLKCAEQQQELARLRESVASLSEQLLAAENKLVAFTAGASA
jgi:transcription initiation factor TFIID subunit TAF12